MLARRVLRSVFFVATLAALTGCRALPRERAESLVRRYNDKLIRAYRLGDERVIEGLVGDSEAKKILGLIGVKADMGITLDAALTEFRLTGLERPGRDAVDVLTEERWHYRDRQIGSGETVGQQSDDHYFLRYALRKERKSWVVSQVSFERPPEVGRTSAPNRASPKAFHGGMSQQPQPAQPPPQPAPGSAPARPTT